MNCRRFRELAHEHVLERGLSHVRDGDPGPRVDASVELERCGAASIRHAAECEHCGSYWRGLLLHGPLLSGLKRYSAPEDLPGRVVAAMHAGYREARAATGIAHLARLQAPPVLARRIEEDFRIKAPAALDRLVERSLDGDDLFPAGARRPHQRRMLAGRGFAAAALLVAFLWLFAPERAAVSAKTRPQALAGAHYGFEIVRVDSLQEAEIDEEARTWIEAVTGGAR